MKRRDLIKLGLLAALLLSPAKLVRAQRPPSKVRVIDIHCHVFNMSDLPAEDFIEKIILRERIEQLKEYLPWLAKVIDSEKIQTVLRVIVNDVRLNAAKPEAEITILNKSEDHRTDRDDAELNTLIRLLGHIWDTKNIKRRLMEIDGHEIDDDIIEIGAQQLRYTLRKTLFPLQYGAYDPEPEKLEKDEHINLAKALYASKEPIGVLGRWVCGFSVRRSELADQLYGLLGGEDQVILMAPALVDFSMWLMKPSLLEKGKPERVASMQSQVDVMARISTRKLGPKIHGYVGFDPLYAAFVEKYPGRFPANPTDVLEDAIHKKGFLGVKLYPPMGFRPIANESLRSQFSSHVTNEKDGLGKDAGKRIDKALTKLYTWCVKHDVPILTHANNSNGSQKLYGQRASPEYWKSVVENPDFKSLRVCLAHFGDFGEIPIERPASLPVIDPANPDIRMERESHQKVNEFLAWEWQLGALFNHSQVYADISYLEEILPVYASRENWRADQKRKAQATHTLKYLKLFKAKFKEHAADRLMFGSDWYMLGADEGFPTAEWYKTPEKSLPVLVDQFLDKADFSEKDREKILYKNAARFLGLTASDRAKGNRGRLETFYKSHSMSADWMTVFDS